MKEVGGFHTLHDSVMIYVNVYGVAKGAINMNNKSYLTEVYNENKLNLMDEKINIFNCPCGSGKTHFALNTLINSNQSGHSRVCYISDTTMLKKSIYKEYVKSLNSNSDLDYFVAQDEHGNVTFSNGMTIYTYAGLSAYLQHNYSNFVQRFDMVVLDEVHQLVRYANRYDSDEFAQYSLVLNLLPDLAKSIKVVAMSADVYPFEQHINDNYPSLYNDVLGHLTLELASYTEFNRRKYVDIKNLLNDIKMDFKTLICVNSIKQELEIKKLLQDKGINAECLWSENNENNKLSKQQLELVDYLLEHESLPEDLQVLIINQAYETGWNLKDNDVRTVIVNTTDQISVNQFRNRIRHDVDSLYTLSSVSELKYDIDECERINTLMREYCNLRQWFVGKDSTSTLCSKLGLYDDKRRLIKSADSINEYFDSIYESAHELVEAGYINYEYRILSVRKKVKGKVLRYWTVIPNDNNYKNYIEVCVKELENRVLHKGDKFGTLYNPIRDSENDAGNIIELSSEYSNYLDDVYGCSEWRSLDDIRYSDEELASLQEECYKGLESIDYKKIDTINDDELKAINSEFDYIYGR